ncbi:tetratricopeptide repeat protein [candidate division WOR-3 bacterium]|uniref:Tetratricopeptide repeat protein n=1 Tax=candidate division WOR-3 bacterium TaxID=2052148 RepID=A0A937XG17_UNCW3|nr:tetratricopeptide repeat protein [candidate division WOR-3 bacterium]
MSGETTSPDKLQRLRERVKSASTPAERVEATLSLAEEIWLKDPVVARPLLEQVVADAEAAGRISDKGRSAYMLGELARRAGDLDAASRHAETVFTVADATGDRRIRASGLNLVGSMHGQRGEHQSAVECFEEYLEVSRQIGFGKGERSALNQLACAHALRGDLGKALVRYQQCLEVNTKAGDSHGRATSLYNIGWTLAAMGRWPEATENFYRAMALCEEHGFSDPLAATRISLGELSMKRSEYDDAAFMFRSVIEAERQHRRAGDVYREALTNLGWTHFRKGDLARAEDVLSVAARLCEAARDRRVLAAVCCRRAELALARGWLDAAGDQLVQAERHAADLNLPTQQGETLRVQALLTSARGDPAQAIDFFSRSEAVLGPLGDTFELALARLQHGRELIEVSRSEEARPLLQAAAQTFRRLAVVAEAEEATMLLYRLELSIDRNAALLEGLLSTTALGHAPEQFVEQVLAMLCDSLQFKQGAVLFGGRPVALRGNPDLSMLTGREAPSQTDLTLLFPVRQEGHDVGLVWLQRGKPLATRVGSDVLEVVTRTLAPALAGLGEIRAIEADSEPQIPGLRFRGVVGRNREVRDLLGIVARLADAPVPVLIRGESGSGKELIARALHESSTRADSPFVTVNCAAVPEALLEAEFFGVEQGAATGVAARPGKFELAESGTIFLDEIGDMSPALQAKLLRVIDEKTVTRVGGTRKTPIEARVVAATNMDLDLREREGLFRRDLLYRLNTVQLVLPPLRRRQEDIPVLTRYFIARAAQEYDRRIHGASDDVLSLFARFDWPGNIRQLQHVVERAVLLADGDMLQVADLPLDLRQRDAVPDAQSRESLRSRVRAKSDEAERVLLVEALRQAKGNTLEAIKLTGFSRRHFFRLLRKHNLNRNSD